MATEDHIVLIKSNTVAKLDLCGKGLGYIEAKTIAEALKDNSRISVLYLSDNEIGDNGAKYLAEVFKINHSLTILHLKSNNIGDAGMQYISEALKMNRFVTTLHIGNNRIGYDGAKYLAESLKMNRFITDLHIGHNNIGSDGAKSLAEALKTNHSIASLNLGFCKIGDAGAKDLAEVLINTFITHLDLQNNDITESGIKYLAEALKINNFITALNIAENNIGSVGTKHISEVLRINHYITMLFLHKSKIGAVGVKDLAEALKINKAITLLNLAYNDIGYTEIKDLAEALKINQSLTILNLNNNNIGNAEIKCLTEALKINQSLTILNLSYNSIGDAGAKDLAEALSISLSIDSVDLQFNKIISASALKNVTKAIKNRKFTKKDKESKLLKFQLRQQEEDKKLANLKALRKLSLIFEGAKTGYQFNYKHQLNIKQELKLIRDVNSLLQCHIKKAILLNGNTGAGKSTLVHLLTGTPLQAIYDSTNELIVEAMQPLQGVIIGHKKSSETTVPNKCLTKNAVIWDCPGFNDTDLVQEIANSFYIRRVFETTEELKFVLVIEESELTNKRGNGFLETFSTFMKCFKDVRSIDGSISIVVTHVTRKKNVHHIKHCIEKIFSENQGALPEQKELYRRNSQSVHLFHRPHDEGEFNVPNLLFEIDNSTKYSEVKADMISITISKKAKEFSMFLLSYVSINFHQMLEVVEKAVTANAIGCLSDEPFNLFSDNYSIIKDYVPSSMCYNSLPKHKQVEYFLELDFLSNLLQVLNAENVSTISDGIVILQQTIEVFAEYADDAQLQRKIQEYAYCLQQQYEFVKFFHNICDPDNIEEMEFFGPEKMKEIMKASHVNIDRNEILKLIQTCRVKVEESLKNVVSRLCIDDNKTDPLYYLKAIKYFDNYLDSPECMKRKAMACICLASICEKIISNKQ